MRCAPLHNKPRPFTLILPQNVGKRRKQPLFDLFQSTVKILVQTFSCKVRSDSSFSCATSPRRPIGFHALTKACRTVPKQFKLRQSLLLYFATLECCGRNYCSAVALVWQLRNPNWVTIWKQVPQGKNVRQY